MVRKVCIHGMKEISNTKETSLKKSKFTNVHLASSGRIYFQVLITLIRSFVRSQNSRSRKNHEMVSKFVLGIIPGNAGTVNMFEFSSFEFINVYPLFNTLLNSIALVASFSSITAPGLYSYK